MRTTYVIRKYGGQRKLRGGAQKGGKVKQMEQKKVKEILGEQLELLAEVSKKTSKPEDLPELTKAMVLLAQNL